MIPAKHQSKSGQFALVTLGALLLVSACTSNTKALNVTNNAAVAPEERIDQDNFPGWHNPMLARAVKYAGQALIADLKSAQLALDLNDLNRADHYLNAAQNLSNGIRTMMPFTVTIDQIRDARGNISVNADLFETDTLLPIYQSLEELDVYAPEIAQQSLDKVGKAEKLAKAGKNTQAVEFLDQVEADISATTVYMPVIAVSQHIDEAMASLKAEPSNKINAQEQIDLALTSMIDETRNTVVDTKTP